MTTFPFTTEFILREYLYGTDSTPEELQRSPIDLSADELDRLVCTHDGRASIILMIRRRADDVGVGLFLVGTKARSRTLWLSVLIGDASALGTNVVTESGFAIVDWAFSKTRYDRIEAITAEKNRLIRNLLDPWMVNEGVVNNILPLGEQESLISRAMMYSISKSNCESVRCRIGVFLESLHY